MRKKFLIIILISILFFIIILVSSISFIFISTSVQTIHIDTLQNGNETIFNLYNKNYRVINNYEMFSFQEKPKGVFQYYSFKIRSENISLNENNNKVFWGENNINISIINNKNSVEIVINTSVRIMSIIPIFRDVSNEMELVDYFNGTYIILSIGSNKDVDIIKSSVKNENIQLNLLNTNISEKQVRIKINEPWLEGNYSVFEKYLYDEVWSPTNKDQIYVENHTITITVKDHQDKTIVIMENGIIIWYFHMNLIK